MHTKHLRSIDLNLLVILNALIEEVSVSRAAARLYLTQPAVSHALERLRTLFGDALLVRQGRGMRLSPRAEALRPQLAAFIASASQLVAPPEVRLDTLRQTVRLAMADYPCALLMPTVLAEVARRAPGVRLVCTPWIEGDVEIERLMRGESDLALSVINTWPEHIHAIKLGADGMVGVCRRDHPLGAAPSLAEFCASPHIIVSARGAERTEVDQWLAELGAQRHVALVTSSFLALPALLEGSDAIALMSASLAAHWPPAASLRRFQAPMPLPYFDIHLGWHQRSAEDAGVRLVRDTLAAFAQRQLGGAPKGHRRATGSTRVVTRR